MPKFPPILIAIFLTLFGEGRAADKPKGPANEQPSAEWIAAGEKRRDEIPLGRYAEPSDLSAAVRFLASDGARHITGATLDVNGGYVMV